MSFARCGAVLAAACLAAVGGGCDSGGEDSSGDAREGGSVAIGLRAAPDSLDPAVATSPEALQALWLVHTPALTYARQEGRVGTRLAPGLAERVPEPAGEGLTYEFTLRRGMRYSDGRPVRPGDFERGMRRALELNPVARRALAKVEGVREAVRASGPAGDVAGISADRRTRKVRIELTEPDPLLPYALASTWAAPVPAGTPSRELARVPGVGPYEVTRRPRGAAYVLARRRGFELPGIPDGNVDLISGRVVPGAAARAAGAISGDLDVVQGELPAPLLPEIRSKYKARYAEYPTLAAEYVELALARSPFREEDVRRAVAYSLDERTLARLEDGFLSPACNVLPPAIAGYEPPDPCPYGDREGNADLVAARDLVEGSVEAGARVLVDGGDGPRARALARYGAETLDKIGLSARVARTSRERARAQLRFASRLPRMPHPARYLEVTRDAAMESRVALLELAGPPRALAGRWARLDHETVEDALLAPYGVRTTGVLLSERLDAANCRRFHPVHGLDLSSLCVR